MTNVHPLRPLNPPPTLQELVDAIIDTNVAIKLTIEDGLLDLTLIGLAYERNKRLLARMEVEHR